LINSLGLNSRVYRKALIRDSLRRLLQSVSDGAWATLSLALLAALHSFRNGLPFGACFSFTAGIHCCFAAMKTQKTNSHQGLLAGGNWIIDQVKLIDVYPQPEQLGNIQSQKQATGGASYNVRVDVATLGGAFAI